MQIKKIAIANFRSIEKSEIDPSAMNVVVGQNNHGKTNFLEAILWFYESKKSESTDYFKKDSARTISVSLTFSGAQREVESMKNEKNKKSIKNLLGSSDEITVVKESSDHKRYLIVSGSKKDNPTGFDTALNDFLPKLEYVTTKVKLEDVSSLKSSSPIAKMLSGVLEEIIAENKKYLALREKFDELFGAEDSEVRVELNNLSNAVEAFLVKQFPEGTKVTFLVSNPDFSDLLKNFETEIDDGVKTLAGQKGDGMQRAVMLAILQAYAEFRKSRGAGRSFLFLIDEGELHLHPSGQRALKRALFDITTRGDQVFLNTHSSVLIADEEESQEIFVAEKTGGATLLKQVDNSEKIDVVYELLGGSPTDLLLPRNFLIVEGKSEYEFILRVFQRFYSEKKKGIQISWGGGDIGEQERTLHGVHKCYNPLATAEKPIFKNRAVILCDKPGDGKQEAKLEQFKKGYPYLIENKQLFVLPTVCLEEYYPKKWVKTYEETKMPEFKKQKSDYAKKVAEEISQNEFEKGMPVIFDAMRKVAELAYAYD